ncbi:helix-turn-helix domain-containing protein, partial [Halobium palmae]
MTNWTTGDDGAFATVAFLAGSPNRVAVLETLAETGPSERRDVVEALDVSRVTAGRVLDALLERGWVERDGRTYETTAAGEVVVDEFGALLDTVEAMDRVAEVLPWLPEDFDVDARRLADARVTVPTW